MKYLLLGVGLSLCGFGLLSAASNRFELLRGQANEIGLGTMAYPLRDNMTGKCYLLVVAANNGASVGPEIPCGR